MNRRKPDRYRRLRRAKQHAKRFKMKGKARDGFLLGVARKLHFSVSR